MNLFSATEPRSEARVLVGTSGYSFQDWVGPFYPPAVPARQHLEYYAGKFRCLEVNVTYYRVPDAKLLRGMCRRTPEHFQFIVKLYGDMTHRLSRDAALYRAFRDALVPMQEAGKLQGLLAQFPFRFKNTESNRGFVQHLRANFPDVRLFTEFRHNSWAVEPVFDFLSQNEVGYVTVDEPQLPGLVPPVVRATTDTGYVRLHGRNARTWFASSPEAGDRYDYSYDVTELGEWAQRIRSLVQETRRVYVFFNNCHGGQAPNNAQAMRELLQQFGLTV